MIKVIQGKPKKKDLVSVYEFLPSGIRQKFPLRFRKMRAMPALWGYNVFGSRSILEV